MTVNWHIKYSSKPFVVDAFLSHQSYINRQKYACTRAFISIRVHNTEDVMDALMKGSL